MKYNLTITPPFKKKKKKKNKTNTHKLFVNKVIFKEISYYLIEQSMNLLNNCN